MAKLPISKKSTGDIEIGLTNRDIKAGKTTATRLIITISRTIKKIAQLCAVELPRAI